MSQFLVEGGVPVAPDVNRIREKFPDSSLNAGFIIYHGDIEALIGEDPKSARYRTVMSRWRRDVEASAGKVILAVRGVGFQVADDHAKYEESVSRGKTAIHHAKRALIVATLTDRDKLEEPERKRLDSVALVSGYLLVKSESETKRLKKGYLSDGGVQ